MEREKVLFRRLNGVLGSESCFLTCEIICQVLIVFLDLRLVTFDFY